MFWLSSLVSVTFLIICLIRRFLVRISVPGLSHTLEKLPTRSSSLWLIFSAFSFVCLSVSCRSRSSASTTIARDSLYAFSSSILTKALSGSQFMYLFFIMFASYSARCKFNFSSRSFSFHLASTSPLISRAFLMASSESLSRTMADIFSSMAIPFTCMHLLRPADKGSPSHKYSGNADLSFCFEFDI